jgi:hypothetical protein
MNTTRAIEIYQTPDGQLQMEVQFEKDTVWLSQSQISTLFNRDRTVITKHINNIFKEGELVHDSVCAKFAHTAEDGKTYQVDFYNLDVIISVGYRVKSKQGTQFRQWATQRLKDYLVKGYSLNQKRLEQLQQVVEVIQRSGGTESLQISEVKGLLEILGNYTQSFIILNQYDSHSLLTGSLNENITYEIQYEEATAAIVELKRRKLNNVTSAAHYGFGQARFPKYRTMPI